VLEFVDRLDTSVGVGFYDDGSIATPSGGDGCRTRLMSEAAPVTRATFQPISGCFLVIRVNSSTIVAQRSADL
jgi:hypothetical protein